MAKRANRIDLSDPKEGKLYFTGISSASGIAVLSNQINKYLDIELSFYSKLMSMKGKVTVDNLVVFTSFEPKENKLETIGKDEFIDFRLPDTKTINKYLFVQCKGVQSILFPRIKQLDYLFVSNYPLENSKPAIKSIPEVTISFDLSKNHIGKRYKYFQGLFYTN